MNFLRTWSVPLGRIFGVGVRIHLSFAFLVIFVLAAALEPSGGGPIKGLYLVGVILFSVLAHELGHILMANVQGRLPRMIMLLPTGGVHLRDNTTATRIPTLQQEAAVALAGPAVNLLIGVIAAITLLSLYPEADLSARPWITPLYPGKSLVWVNFLLAALSLVPAYPLDGGRILRMLFIDSHSADPGGSFAEATRRVVAMGQAFSVFLMFAGIWNPWIMLVGFFLFLGVQIEDRSLLFQSVIESVRLEEIMLTDFAILSPADTLHDALHKAVHTLQDDFPVVRSGEMVGVISKQNIIDALRDDGNGYVQSAMKRAFEIAGRNESLAGAFRRITKGTTVIPVVESERLIGIVTLQNLMHSMGLLAESRRLRKQLEE